MAHVSDLGILFLISCFGTNTYPILEDGGWAVWGQWSQCSSSCGNGRKTRRRKCIPPKCGGKDYCVGLARQRVSCNSGCCPGNR
jgi:hypothetical protein